jgi:RNA 2',3'-cyclic 3'-phosphodiesterase
VRLFVAAYPPEAAAGHLAAAVDTLAVGRAAADGVNARLAARDTWHVTLAFLGEVADERRPDVEAALGRGIAGWQAQRRGGPPELRLAGGGRFGRGRFTILWIGLDGDVDALTGLGRALRRELKRIRVECDRRPFRPHLTLARPGDRVDVRDDIAALNAYAGPPWPVEEVRLMRSHLGPKPTYDQLASWSLAVVPG